ncbi:MarR family winged helix-turn-helix transcriptional regulator [Kribbella sp. NPDC058245]|uniref:MarR family winged helix-turn-helix transcriptional regulator n=1 Tax=Kribbella sp. NPDC058245 TaxID=3346399 RepID=UPI0036E53447
MTPDRPDSGPTVSTGFWLHHAALSWRARLSEALKPLGLTHTQFLLLASVGWLAHVGPAPTQQEVAAEAGTDRMMTSKVISTLEQRNLLTRERDNTDARMLRLQLTTEGRNLVRRATKIARDIDQAVFGSDSSALRTTLRGVAAPD